MTLPHLIQVLGTLGADHVGLVPVEEISFEPAFRSLCEQNACGMYGRSWMCPPEVGEIHALIAQARQYEIALVFQTIDHLVDIYDFEGMMAAGDRMNRLLQAVRKEAPPNALILGAGGCRRCRRCAKMDQAPCRFPDQALASLEAYGVNVSLLAPQAGMQYINGVNTVTYFGAIFLGKNTSRRSHGLIHQRRLRKCA